MATAAVIRDGWPHTGDLAVTSDRGYYKHLAVPGATEDAAVAPGRAPSSFVLFGLLIAR